MSKRRWWILTGLAVILLSLLIAYNPEVSTGIGLLLVVIAPYLIIAAVIIATLGIVVEFINPKRTKYQKLDMLKRLTYVLIGITIVYVAVYVF